MNNKTNGKQRVGKSVASQEHGAYWWECGRCGCVENGTLFPRNVHGEQLRGPGAVLWLSTQRHRKPRCGHSYTRVQQHCSGSRGSSSLCISGEWTRHSLPCSGVSLSLPKKAVLTRGAAWVSLAHRCSGLGSHARARAV